MISHNLLQTLQKPFPKPIISNEWFNSSDTMTFKSIKILE